MNWQLTEKMSTISVSIAGFHSKLFQLRFEIQKIYFILPMKCHDVTLKFYEGEDGNKDLLS